MNKKEWVNIILAAFFIGALGSIVMGRYLIPYMATFPGLSGLNKLVTNSPIVVTRREEVQLNEGVNLIDLIKQSGNIAVNIYTPSVSATQYLGSGVVISGDGMIFTTTQVIGTNQKVRIQLNDGKTYDGLVRATDPKSELAIVTIPASNLSVAQFEDSNNLQTGQRVFVVGQSNNAFTRNFQTGFVTASLTNSQSLEKIFSTETFEEMFKTDIIPAADVIGGPVFNLQGRVVGILGGSRIIKSEDLQTALNTYLNLGKIIRPSMGLHYFDLSMSLALMKGLPQAGALVATVDKNSPADKAGLQANDLIISVENQSLDQISFEQVLNRHSVSDMKISVLRAGKTLELTVPLIQK